VVTAARQGRQASRRFAARYAEALPAAVDAFVGRSDEVLELGALLERRRLVNLTGPPGIGKTRLALEVARDRAGDYRDGAVLVELAAISDPALVLRTVAAALSVQEVAGQSLPDVLVACLRRRSLLLVLDNCEHLLVACSQLVDTLLHGCPELRVLATSREPLSIAGEHVWDVSGLSTPDRAQDLSPENLIGFDAVRLFVERAAAVRRGFELDDEVAPTVAEIARRLDGIPLALELAAARLEMLSAAEIVQYLDQRFALLSNGVRGAVSRHRTLQAAVDWSYALLSEPERAVLRRLSVFMGGFDLDAAVAVCAAGSIEPAEVFGVLARLISKSLVLADTASPRGRYRLLETIRAYGSDRLDEAAETAATAEAHAAFYVALAEEAEPQLTGRDQLQWLDRLDRERENMRLAVGWSLANDRPVWALRLAGALVLFWRVRCHFSEGRELLDAVIAAGDGASEVLLAKAVWGSGFLAFMAGDSDAATPLLEDGVARFRAAHDVQGCARALLVLGNRKMSVYRTDGVRMLEESAKLAREADDSWCLSHALSLAGIWYCDRSELGAAGPLLEEALAVARARRDSQSLRFALLALGRVSLGRGEYRAAERLLDETVRLVRELGDDPNTATATMHLADLAFGRGDYARARTLLEEALALLGEASFHDSYLQVLMRCPRVAHAQGDLVRTRALFEEISARYPRRVSHQLLLWKGELAEDDGDHARARRFFEESLTIARPIRVKRDIAWALHCLGGLDRASGALPRATALHHEALQLQREIGDAPGIVASIEALAGVHLLTGREAHAGRLLGAAHAHREREDYARLPWESRRYDADLALLRETLPVEELDALWADGACLSIAQAGVQASKGRRRRGRPSIGWESLTETEQQIATLVADGLTNPEIANRVFIAPSTARNHVSNILGKLGVAKRTEVARLRP
jgi:predicted ATPase/DNA-binding CsgD family transcriptional regulator